MLQFALAQFRRLSLVEYIRLDIQNYGDVPFILIQSLPHNFSSYMEIQKRGINVLKTKGCLQFSLFPLCCFPRYSNVYYLLTVVQAEMLQYHKRTEAYQNWLIINEFIINFG